MNDNHENLVLPNIENWTMPDVLTLVEEIILENLSLERKIDLWGQILFSMNRLKPGDPVINDWGADAYRSARELMAIRIQELNLDPEFMKNPILAINQIYNPGSPLHKTHSLEALRISQILYYFFLINLDKAGGEEIDGAIICTIGIGSPAVRFANASDCFYECISMAAGIYELFNQCDINRLPALLPGEDINPDEMMYYVCHFAAEAAMNLKRFPEALEWSLRGEPFVSSLPQAYAKSDYCALRGGILIELGQAEEALEWYEKGSNVPGLTPQELNDAKRNLETARYIINGDYEKIIEGALAGFLDENDRKLFIEVVKSAMAGSTREENYTQLFALFKKLLSDGAMESFVQHTALNVHSLLHEFRQYFILGFLRGELENKNFTSIESVLPEVRQLTESNLPIGLDAEIFLLQYRKVKGEDIPWETIEPLLAKVSQAASSITLFLFYLFPILVDLGTEGLQKAAPIIASLIKKIDFNEDDRRTPLAEIQQTAIGMDSIETLLALLVEIAGCMPEERAEWWLANVSRLKMLSSYRGQRMQKESLLFRYSSLLPPDTVKRIEALAVSLTEGSLKRRGVQTPESKKYEIKLKTLLYSLYNQDWENDKNQGLAPLYPEITHIEMASFQQARKNQAPVISVSYTNKIWNRYFSEEIDDGKINMYCQFLRNELPLSAIQDGVNVGLKLKNALLPGNIDFGGSPFLGVRSTGIYHNIPLDCLPLTGDEASSYNVSRYSSLRASFFNVFEQIVSEQKVPGEENEEMSHWIGEKITSVLLTGDNSDLSILEKQLAIKKIAVFANSSFKGGYKSLPGVINETKAIERNFQDTDISLLIYRETESNRENFLKLSGIDAPQILHIATHGIFHKKYSSGSFIVLSDKKPDGSPILGAVGYHDIMLMDLRQCDLVVLSACSTHEGVGILGEGIMGLAWAFKAAGAKAVIGTRWPVCDEAAAEFWGKFYHYLFFKESLETAFHNARLDLIKQKKFNHPFYWGVFQLIV